MWTVLQETVSSVLNLQQLCCISPPSRQQLLHLRALCVSAHYQLQLTPPQWLGTKRVSVNWLMCLYTVCLFRESSPIKIHLATATKDYLHNKLISWYILVYVYFINSQKKVLSDDLCCILLDKERLISLASSIVADMQITDALVVLFVLHLGVLSTTFTAAWLQNVSFWAYQCSQAAAVTQFFEYSAGEGQDYWPSWDQETLDSVSDEWNLVHYVTCLVTMAGFVWCSVIWRKITRVLQ